MYFLRKLIVIYYKILRKKPLRKTTSEKILFEMSEEIYKNFIASVMNEFPLVSKSEWKHFLGKGINGLDTLKGQNLKNKALSIYYARIASNLECTGMTDILNLPDKDIKNYVIEMEKHKKDNGVKSKSFEYYEDEDKAIRHMKDFYSENDLEKLIGSPQKVKKVVGSPSRKSKKSKSPKKSKNLDNSSNSKKVMESSKSNKKSKTSDKKAEIAKSPKSKKVSDGNRSKTAKTSKTTSSPKKSEKGNLSPKAKKVSDTNKSKKTSKKSKSDDEDTPPKRSLKLKEGTRLKTEEGVQLRKNCNRYTIAQLKQLASDNGVKIPSGLKKAEICEIVKDAGLLDIIITEVDASKDAKKFKKSDYIYDPSDENLIIGTKRSGKYSPLEVEDRLLLAKLKIPFKFATNKELEKLFFFPEMKDDAIKKMMLPKVAPKKSVSPPKKKVASKISKEYKPRAPKKELTPEEIFEKKKARNAAKNKELTEKLEKNKLQRFFPDDKKVRESTRNT